MRGKMKTNTVYAWPQTPERGKGEATEQGKRKNSSK